MKPLTENLHPRFTRLLIATDFSAASEVACQVAKRLAALLGAHLLILHVFEYSDAGSPKTGGIAKGLLAFRHTAEIRLNELRQSVRMDGLEAQDLMVDGIASEAILETIREKRIDLVVLGTRAAPGLERLVLGSTAEKVFRKAGCPVLTVGPLVPMPLDAPHVCGPVVLATDINLVSRPTIRDAARLCKQTGSTLHCLHVLPQSEMGGLHENVPCETSTAAMQRMVQESGVPSEHAVCAITYNNDISAGVVDYAKRHNSVLIVLGVRHAPTVVAHLPAHVTYRIIAKATCPVLTVSFEPHAPLAFARSLSVTGAAG